MERGHRVRRPAARVAALVTLLVLGTLQVGLSATPAAAAGTGQYSPPIWWPLRGDNLVGCAYLSTDGTGTSVCGGTYHPYWGLDIQAYEGQPIYASGSGFATVHTDSTGCTSYGRSVVVDHNGRKSLYAHLSQFSAALTSTPGGVWVDRNTVIGYAGHTGNVSGCTYDHLHYEESTSGTFRDGSTDYGPFMACLGTTLKTYPSAMGVAKWEGFPAHTWTTHTDGGACEPPSNADPRPSGSFVQTDDGRAWRVVGGSLLHVTNWQPFGGLPLVLPIVDPTKYLPFPQDGTAVQTAPGSATYVFAGGAPLLVTDAAAIGNPPKTVVNDAALTSASSFSFGHVRPVPANGTIVRGLPSGSYWMLQNGARSPAPASASAVAVNDGTVLALLRFWDVPPGASFAADIAWLTTTGITTGNADGSFGSAEPVSRQAMAAFLYRYAGRPAGETPTCAVAPKIDVPVGSPFCGEIAWLLDAGIANGFPDGTFRPTDMITREAMAAFLYRFAGHPDGLAPTCAAAPKTDIPVGRVFCGEIAWMVTSGVSTGYPDDTFRPTLFVRRDAMAAFLHRLSVIVPLG